MTSRLVTKLIKMVCDTSDTLLKHFVNYKLDFLLNICLYDKYADLSSFNRNVPILA